MFNFSFLKYYGHAELVSASSDFKTSKNQRSWIPKQVRNDLLFILKIASLRPCEPLFSLFVVSGRKLSRPERFALDFIKPNWHLSIKILLALFCCAPLYGQVYLTEIMFNPLEDEDIYEFVEIWNSGSDSVDLSGWRLGDGSGEDEIIPAQSGLILPGGWFGLILDPDYFNSSRIYDSLIGDQCIILTVTSSALGSSGLNNSAAETVNLIDNFGVVPAAYQYTIGNLPGYSEEKIILDGEDIPANWSDSQSLYGSPGFSNTVSPDSLDLAVLSLTYEPAMPINGETIYLTAVVKNTGVEVFPPFTLGFMLDDGDGVFTVEEIFELVSSGSINSGEEREISIETVPLVTGWYNFAAKVMEADDDTLNNLAACAIYIGAEINSLTFNEVMYKPVAGEAEWLEIYNNSAGEMSLTGWSFADADSSDKIWFNVASISGGGMLVIAKDSSILDLYQQMESINLLVTSSWNALNNTGDTLYLFDPAGNIIDQLDYGSDWGGVDNGISMERITPQSALWLPCADEDGGTPGRQNSVYFTPMEGNSAVLTAIPEVFSPDGDGFEDVCEINVRLPVPYARINLRIFDTNGRLVKFLVRNDIVGSSSAFVWDGNWDDGKNGRIGVYIVHLEAISEAFKSRYEARKVVVLAGKL